MGSSMATASPGRFSHFATVASATDSPRLGTLISVAIALSRSECLGDEMRLLFDVALEEAGGRGSGFRAAGKARPLRRDVEPGEHLLDAAVDKGPGAHILRLFLAPDDL